MARYVDGFVIPIQKKQVKAYLKQARWGARLWRKHGALAYYECVGDDLEVPFGQGFKGLGKLRKGETAVFSFIVYRSRAHRDRVNAAVMADPAMAGMMKEMERNPPFPVERMAMGGFTALVAW
jgi:uncharacterized protein YbaA (DUF1428 family)